MNFFIRLLTFSFYLIFILVFTSCVSNKKIVYFQGDIKSDTIKSDKPTYVLQPGDVLSIKVYTADPVISSFFNVEPINQNTQANPGSLYLSGYSISDSGYVNIPIIGHVYLKGLTIEAAQEKLQKALATQVVDATVVVKFLSYKFSVLGEVKAPGLYYGYNNQITLLEAIGMAGDLTQFGNRKKIKLIRKTESGSVVYQLDLTDPALIGSDKYFILPNDAIYVQPLKALTARNNVGQATVIFAGISTLILILNFISR